MRLIRSKSERDLEKLCAYLDGELSRRQAAHLENRLEVEPTLQQQLVEMRNIRALLREQPQAPLLRNLTLGPEHGVVRSVKGREALMKFRECVLADEDLQQEIREVMATRDLVKAQAWAAEKGYTDVGFTTEEVLDFLDNPGADVELSDLELEIVTGGFFNDCGSGKTHTIGCT